MCHGMEVLLKASGKNTGPMEVLLKASGKNTGPIKMMEPGLY